MCKKSPVDPAGALLFSSYFSSSWSPPHLRLRSWIFDPNKLRIKLQNDYRHPRFIATVPGKGYRFVPTFTNEGWTDDEGDEDGDE